MNFDCFKWDFVIFGTGNEYQDAYSSLYKLKSDFNGWLCQEKLANKCCCAINKPKTGWLWEKTGISWDMGKLWVLVWRYLNALSFNRIWNYSISSGVDKVMTNLLTTMQNTLKLGAEPERLLYEQICIDWVTEKL